MDMDNPDMMEASGDDEELVESPESADEEPASPPGEPALEENADDAEPAIEYLFSSGAVDESPPGEPPVVDRFDISLAGAHAYMTSSGIEMVTVSGSSVLEPGARALLPCLVHHGTVFPGDTVPLVLRNPEDAITLLRIREAERLFVLLSPETNLMERRKLSGYGVVCEVFEAAKEEERVGYLQGSSDARALGRALSRCKLVEALRAPEFRSGADDELVLLCQLRYGVVEVLREQASAPPLHAARLACLDQRRPRAAQPARWLSALDAVVTPWPLFVYDFLDLERMRKIIKDYFKTFGLETRLPEPPVELSFWVARNLSLSPRDQSALFAVDDAILRLHMECTLISRCAAVCCELCCAVLARRAHLVCMSSSGVHATFTNEGGYMYDVVTTRRAAGVRLTGAPSSEFSWFPGYAWTVLACLRCDRHAGWRFDAISEKLRPRRFYALCRYYNTAPEPAQ